MPARKHNVRQADLLRMGFATERGRATPAAQVPHCWPQLPHRANHSGPLLLGPRGRQLCLTGRRGGSEGSGFW